MSENPEASENPEVQHSPMHESRESTTMRFPSVGGADLAHRHLTEGVPAGGLVVGVHGGRG